MTEVLPVQGALRSSTSHTSFFDATASYRSSRRSNYSYSDLRSSRSLSSSPSASFNSTPASSLSLDTKFDDDDDDGSDDDGLMFPAYSSGRWKTEGEEEHRTPPSSPVQPQRPSSAPFVDGEAQSCSAPTPEALAHSEDDTAVRAEPSQHVDYLSYEWKEEDIWSSWRHIVEHRKVYGERSRLENASWRTWAKSQFKLKTISPETLNWLKDCDVTWLYGPLQPASNRNLGSQNTSEPMSRLSKTNSFLNKKPILKKRSMSELMLQKSISASSLVKQAAAAVQAQQATGGVLEQRRRRPIIGRAASDFVTSSIPSHTTSRDPTDYFSSQSTSGLHTPDQGERKHIRFDDKVEQCIAVECKDADEDDDYNDSWISRDDDESSDDGIVMMKKARKRKPLSRNHSRTSLSGESKTIAKLPSTTLKYRTDSPDLAGQQPTHSLGFFRSSRLSPSPSQETLRPSNPSTNFLLSEDDEDDDPWEPSAAFEAKRPSTPTPQIHRVGQSTSIPSSREDNAEESGLRRTPSGMFMPFEDMEEEHPPPGIIGRMVDTVNTARDIAHVIWNVGWRN